MSALDSVVIAIQYPDTTWADITSTVLIGNTLTARWGIMGIGPRDRIATSGEIRFTMSDPDLTWTNRIAAYGSSTSWDNGTPFFIALYFQGVSYLKKRGTIKRIKPSLAPNTDIPIIEVTVGDWIDYAARYPITVPTVATDQRSDQAISAVLTLMDNYPSAYTLDTGSSTFPTIFDVTKTKGTAYAEFSKAVLSEWGYLYLKSDRLYGETLIFENMLHRSGVDTLSAMPSTTAILDETGARILDENGKYILADDYTTFAQTDQAHERNADYDNGIINRAVVRAYPRTADDAVTGYQVLYKLGSSIQIGPGEVKTLHVSYTDPYGGGSSVNALVSSMQTPTATTDYLMNSQSNGGGTNRTSDLTVSATYSTSGIDYTLTNANAANSYITKLQARGYGVYSYNAIESTAENEASQAIFGINEISIDQRYQQDLVIGEMVAKQIVSAYARPFFDLESITYHANRSPDLMNAFLSLDVGDMVHIIESGVNVDGYFDIQSVAFKLYGDKLIDFTWTLKRHRLLTNGWTEKAIGFDGTSNSAINFGYVPHIDVGLRSFHAYVYLDTLTADVVIGGPWGDAAGTLITIVADGAVKVEQWATGGKGIWVTSVGGLITTGSWHYVQVIRPSDGTGTFPLIFVDVDTQSLTETAAQTGTLLPETGCNFVIGNTKNASEDYPYNFDGQIKGMGITDYTTGLNIFDAFYVADEQSYLYDNGTTLTEDMKVVDGVYGIVGTPVNSPTSQWIT